MNLGEVLGVAVNSKGRIVVLNHPGSATSGPLYGNASTQLLEFDANGKFVREIGQGVYGLGYAHGVRFDKYDNLWVVDKGTHSVMRFNPAGYVTLNLGRRPEGPDEPEGFNYGQRPRTRRSRAGRRARRRLLPRADRYRAGTATTTSTSATATSTRGSRSSTSTATGSSRGARAAPAASTPTENPGQFNTPHNIGVDRQNNVYVADRNNRRIQVFDRDGNFQRFILLNAPYDKKRHPVLGNLNPNPPDETQPWTICITNGPTQYLYTSDSEPGRIYKMTLDGKIVGMLGESGHDLGQFNWTHGLACPSEDVLFVADMNNWRVQKLLLRPERPGVRAPAIAGRRCWNDSKNSIAADAAGRARDTRAASERIRRQDRLIRAWVQGARASGRPERAPVRHPVRREGHHRHRRPGDGVRLAAL